MPPSVPPSADPRHAAYNYYLGYLHIRYYLANRAPPMPFAAFVRLCEKRQQKRGGVQLSGEKRKREEDKAWDVLAPKHANSPLELLPTVSAISCELLPPGIKISKAALAALANALQLFLIAVFEATDHASARALQVTATPLFLSRALEGLGYGYLVGQRPRK